MIFALPAVCHLLSKCHGEIYKCVRCQTKLIFLSGAFGARGEKNLCTLEINRRKFIAGTCGLKIGSHTHNRINDLDGFFYVCACSFSVCLCRLVLSFSWLNAITLTTLHFVLLSASFVAFIVDRSDCTLMLCGAPLWRLKCINQSH